MAVGIAIFCRALSIALWAAYASRALPTVLERQRAAAAAAAADDNDDVVGWQASWAWGPALALSATALVAQLAKLGFILAAARRVGHLPHVAGCGAHRRLAEKLARKARAAIGDATVVASPLSVAKPASAADDENPQ